MEHTIIPSAVEYEFRLSPGDPLPAHNNPVSLELVLTGKFCKFHQLFPSFDITSAPYATHLHDFSPPAHNNTFITNSIWHTYTERRRTERYPPVRMSLIDAILRSCFIQRKTRRVIMYGEYERIRVEAVVEYLGANLAITWRAWGEQSLLPGQPVTGFDINRNVEVRGRQRTCDGGGSEQYFVLVNTSLLPAYACRSFFSSNLTRIKRIRYLKIQSEDTFQIYLMCYLLLINYFIRLSWVGASCCACISTKRLNHLCSQLYPTVSLLYQCHTTCFGYI
jgi:hypothetical protein